MLTLSGESRHVKVREQPGEVELSTYYATRRATRVVVPSSASERDMFDFELSADEIAIDELDAGRRGGPEPDAITLEAFGWEIPET